MPRLIMQLASWICILPSWFFFLNDYTSHSLTFSKNVSWAPIKCQMPAGQWGGIEMTVTRRPTGWYKWVAWSWKKLDFLKRQRKVLKGKTVGNKEATYATPRHCEILGMGIRWCLWGQLRFSYSNKNPFEHLEKQSRTQTLVTDSETTRKGFRVVDVSSLVSVQQSPT